jgi:hypothetical protein
MSLLMLQTLVQASGAEEYYQDYSPVFFDDALAGKGNTDFLQFRYSLLNDRLQDDWHWEGDSTYVPTTADTADGNRAEWAAYAGGLPLADVDSFVYTYPRTSLSALYYNLEKGTAAGSTQTYEGNAMTKWFRRAKDLEALGYLMWAKQVEEATTKPGNYSWEAPPPPDAAQLQKLQKGGGQLLAAAKGPFVKQRYAYQLLKLQFQGGQYRELLAGYDSLAGGATGNMATRMLGLKAGAHYKLKQKAQAAYLYSRVFDQGPEWRRTAFISYDWSDGYKLTPAVLKQCSSPHERAVVYLLSGFQEGGEALPQLAAAAKEDPAIAGLEALFTREINKVESGVLDASINPPVKPLQGNANPKAVQEYAAAQKRAADNRTYLSGLVGFGQLQASRVPAAQQGYWHIALAYLGFMQGNESLLQEQLALAGKAPLSLNEKNQVTVLQLLQTVKVDAPITGETEARMLPYLKQLDARVKNSPEADRIYRNFIGAFLAGKYGAQKDSVKALFALARVQRSWGDDGQIYSVADDYTDVPGEFLEGLSPAGFEAVKAFAASNAHSPFENWLLQSNAYPIGRLYDLEGTRKMRQYKFAEAATLYAKVPKEIAQKYLLTDPFKFDAGPYIDDNGQTKTMTRGEFATKMAGLQSKTDAQSLYEYGLGLYGMSYYGWGHRAYDYYRSGSSGWGYYEEPGQKELAQSEREYYKVYSAEKAFVNAAAATTSKELKAAAFFMASKCWQKRTPVTKERTYYEDRTHYLYSLKSPYFKYLKTDYAGTQTYEEILRQCAYFKDYVKKR